MNAQEAREIHDELWKKRIKEGTGLNEANISALSLLPESIEGKKILEIGSGTGDLLVELKKRGAWVQGTDISRVACTEAEKRGIGTINIDLNEKLPFSMGSFDLVISIQVLMHLYGPQAMLLEMARVSGENVLVNVPNHLWWRNRLKLLVGNVPRIISPQGGHLRMFSYGSARKMIESAGLEIEKEAFTGTFPLSRRLPMQKGLDGLVKEWPSALATGFSFLCKKVKK